MTALSADARNVLAGFKGIKINFYLFHFPQMFHADIE